MGRGATGEGRGGRYRVEILLFDAVAHLIQQLVSVVQAAVEKPHPGSTPAANGKHLLQRDNSIWLAGRRDV